MMKSGRNGPDAEKAKDINACTVTMSPSVRCQELDVTHSTLTCGGGAHLGASFEQLRHEVVPARGFHVDAVIAGGGLDVRERLCALGLGDAAHFAETGDRAADVIAVGRRLLALVRKRERAFGQLRAGRMCAVLNRLP